MSKLAAKIAEEAMIKGVIPFSRFMELALYCPEYGYYEEEKDNIGKGGDFYTSVSVGALFGQLLAAQFCDWLRSWSSLKGPPRIAEAGAHDGKLAADILSFLQEFEPDLFAGLEYWIIEPSERRRGRQKAALERLFPGTVRWATSLQDLKDQTKFFDGILFANELLDAMPIQRLVWDKGRRSWFECGVAFDGSRFVWNRMAEVLNTAAHPLLSTIPPGLLHLLPDRFCTEFSPSALEWWSAAARVVSQGALLTFDYGLETEELVMPQRSEGTLRAYREHRLNRDVLADPGEQDITAHVNFTLLAAAGERENLRTAKIFNQAQFLTRVAGAVWTDARRFVSWGERQTRQFRTLTSPDGLGRALKVLLQSHPETSTGLPLRATCSAL